MIESEKSEYSAEIFAGRSDGSWRIPLTRGERSAGSPSWSPDGKHVFFLSDRSGSRRIWCIAIGGGEAERLTDWKGAMGWSYSGYMTAWTITPTRRFKAAAAGAGVTDIWSQAGTSDIRENKIVAFGAPWEKLDTYLERSPLYHVKNITTPTLILHGELDERAPATQGYELYNALKRRGVETRMVVYPRAPHGVREPKFVR